MISRAYQSGTLIDAVVDVVANFGADPTYNTDSTAAFQAALAAISTNSVYRGGKIHIPPGHYKITQTLTATSYNYLFNIFFEGDGPNNTVLDFSGIAAAHDGIVFDATAGLGGAHFGAKGFTVINATGNGINVIGTANFAEQFHFENLRIQFNGASGFKATSCYMGTMTDVWSWGNGGNGFEFDGFHTSIAFMRCWGGGSAAYPGGGNNTHGWSLTNMTYCTWISCGADFNSNNGYYCIDLYGCAWVGSGSESNQKEGWYFSGSSVGSAGITLTSCAAYNNSMAGIGLYANFVGAISAAGLANGILINGAYSRANSASDVNIVANGASGVVAIKIDGYTSTVSSQVSISGTATITDRSGAWDYLKVRQSAAQAVTGGTPVAINFNALDTANALGSWNGSNTWTCPATGTYQISGSVRTTTDSLGFALGSWITVGGGRLVDGSLVQSAGTNIPMASHVSASIQISAGVAVQYIVSPPATGNLDPGASNTSIWMTIARVA